MRRLSRLLRRVPRDAPDGPAQEELETPPPAAVSCVSPCATNVDQFSAEHHGDGMDRAHDAWDQQAPEAAQAGKAPAAARSAAADGMGGAAVAHVAEAAPGAAAATESAPDVERAAVERVVPALKAAPSARNGEVEYGQRVPGAFAAGDDPPAPSAAVGARSDSAFAEADSACVSLAHVTSQSDPELSPGAQSSQSAAGSASPKHAGRFDSAQSHTQPPVLLSSVPGSSSGASSSVQSDAQSTVAGSSSLASARRTSATPHPAQSDAQPSVVLPPAASPGPGASSPTKSNTGSVGPGSALFASTSSSRAPTNSDSTTQPDTQPTLPPVLPSTSTPSPSANPNPRTSTSSRTHLDPHVAIPLASTSASTSAPTSSHPDPAQPEPPVIPPPDPRIPRTLPLGTTMIVQGLVQTIGVNRPPVPTNQAPRTNEERTNDEATNERERANDQGETSTVQGDAINESQREDESTNEEEPLLSADKDEEDKNDDKGESSSGQESGQSSTQAMTTPHRSTTPPPPPNFTAIPTRLGVPPPSSTDVLGLLLSIAAQATAEALVPWSVPPRSRAPASWTGAPGREGIASGLAAAFSALASAGTGGPPPTEPITVPAPPPPAPEPAPVTAPTSPSPRRRESASSPARRFASRRLSALVPGRSSGSRQSSVQDVEGNEASATATINEPSATATIHEASAVNEAGSSLATTMSTPMASTSTTNATSATNTPHTSTGSNLAGSNLASASSASTPARPNAAPKPERRRGVLGTLRRLVPWRSSGASRPWRRRASAPQVETPVRAAQVHASTPSLVPPVDETPLESQADPAPIVVSQADEPVPAPEVEEADFGRAPPTPVSPTPLPESSVSPSPTLAVPPSTIPIPAPPNLSPPSPPSPPTTDAEDLVRFSRMLGFTPGAVHPSGSFERFLADMQDELRAALGEYQERVRGRVRDERVEAAVPASADPATSVDPPMPVADSSTPTPADTSRLLDHTRPHIPSTDPLPLNWWRMYRFPALPGVQVPPNTNAGMIVTGVSSSSPPSSETSTESPESTSPPSSDASVESLPSSGASTATPDSNETATVTPESTPSPEPVESPTPDENATQPVHPAIIIGLRSVTRDLDEPPSATVPGNETTADDSGSGRDQSSDTGRGRTRRGSLAHRFGLGRESGRREEPVEGERETEERRSREGTRNYIIWIIGGYYPSGHPLLAHPNLFLGQVHPDELWMLNEFLGQVKPPTASREEIAKAGLRVVKGTEVQELASSGSVTENCTERCLICLDDYADEEDLRIMNCKHMFHKDCVDRWMETGRNNCPACRTKGVDTTTTPATTV